MQKAQPVIYIDPSGKEHEALVRALNGLHPGRITVVYVDEKAAEPDNLKTIFDVPYMTDDSRQEPNPALPTYHVNCWKEYGEEHNALPGDHPHFDHPFHVEYEVDGEGNQKIDPQTGKPIRKQIVRTEYEAQLAEHQAKPETQAAMAAAAAGNTYGPESAEYKDAQAFLDLRGYSAEASAEILARSAPERIKEMSDTQREYEASRNSPEYVKQLEAAMEQGSDALFAKDAEIRKLQETNTALIEQIAQLKTPPSTSTEGAATGSATEPDVATQLDQAPPAPEVPGTTDQAADPSAT